MVDAITALQAAGVPVSPVSLTISGCTTGPSPVCTGGLFPNSGTSTSFLSTFPNSNKSDNGIAKIDYHPNDKNTIFGTFFLGHYNAVGEDHPFPKSVHGHGANPHLVRYRELGLHAELQWLTRCDLATIG